MYLNEYDQLDLPALQKVAIMGKDVLPYCHLVQFEGMERLSIPFSF